jgi:hypothetical protein
MVITTDAIDPPVEGAPKRHPAYSFNRLVKQDIIRHGQAGWTRTARTRTVPPDPPSAAQIACRAPFRFMRPNWWNFNNAVKDQWNDAHPVDPFCEAVKRWLAGHSPSDTPYYPLDDPSDLTVNASAATCPAGIALTFTPSGWYALWGIAIIRDNQEITEPDPFMLIVIYPTTTAEEKTYLDCPRQPGTYHYRFAACEITGKRGPFSPDVSATFP